MLTQKFFRPPAGHSPVPVEDAEHRARRWTLAFTARVVLPPWLHALLLMMASDSPLVRRSGEIRGPA